MEILIDDASPQISYYSSSNSTSEGWIVNHSKGQRYSDEHIGEYSQSTFHKTYHDGDRMEFRFNGSGITVYGAKRDNHATYGVQMDGSNPIYTSGHTDDAQFQTPIYSQYNMPSDVEHVIIVTNRPNAMNATVNPRLKWWLDIDHIVITQSIEEEVHTSTIDNTSPFISYDEGWTTDVSDNAQLFNGTQHISTIPSSTMTMNFNGSSVQLFGSLDQDHGNYSISLDGVEEGMYSATNWENLKQVSLFLATGLEDGPHTLQLTNLGKSNITTIDFDYAVVNSTIKPDGTPEPAPPTATPNETNESQDSAATSVYSGGAIAGVAIAIILGIIALALGGWYIYRRRRQSRSDYSESPDISPVREMSTKFINHLPVPRKSTEGSLKREWSKLPDPPQTADTTDSFYTEEPTSRRTSNSRRDTVIPSLASFRASFPSLFHMSFRSSHLPTVEPNVRDSKRGSKSIMSKFPSILPRSSYQNNATKAGDHISRSSYQSHPFKASSFTPRGSYQSNAFRPGTQYTRSSRGGLNNQNNNPYGYHDSEQLNDYTNSQGELLSSAIPSSAAITSPMFSEFFAGNNGNNGTQNDTNTDNNSPLTHPQPSYLPNVNRARISVAVPMRHLSVPYTATMVDFDSSAYTTTSIFSSRRGTGISEDEIDLGLFSIPEFAPPAYAQATRISLGPGRTEELIRANSK